MKATLEFNLPEEEAEFNHSKNGSKFASAIRELDNHLRGKIKHGALSDKELAIYEEIRQLIYGELDGLDVF